MKTEIEDVKGELPADRVRTTWLPPARPVGADQAVLKALSDFVARAGLGEGDRLPPERELAERLGVGRSTVREALKRWEALGVVAMRKGSGTYLAMAVGADAIHAPVTLRVERQAVLYILELRRTIEVESARLAALRATEADRARIMTALEALETAYAKWGVAVQEDRAFHEAIYAASHNPLFLQIFRQVVTRFNDAFNATDANPFVVKPFTDGSMPDHRRLALAIQAGDPDGAVATVTAILDFVEQEIRDARG